VDLPKGPSPDLTTAISRLTALIASLLDPVSGCPWDREQTTETLSEDWLEESFELREALRTNEPLEILEEGGDVVFLITFIATLTHQKWGFGLKEMVDGVVDKMIRRHPHVFNEVKGVNDAEAVLNQWHQIKRQKNQGLLASVPRGLPALTRCQRLSSKVARAGFDWSEVAEVRAAIDLELAELDAEIAKGDFKNPDQRERLSHELGDVLMVMVNLARHLKLAAEKSLAAACDRFTRRFEYIERDLAGRDLKPEDVDLDELERLWGEAKKV
jgi:MazG family protein